MKERDIRTAAKFGILERCKEFEEDLLKIRDIVPDKFADGGVDFSIDNFPEIPYVIIIPKYDIRADREDYWEAREALRKNVVALAEKHDLHRTGDRIEDYGEHFYFVFSCGSSWKTNIGG